MQIAYVVCAAMRTGWHDDALSSELDDGGSCDTPTFRWHVDLPECTVVDIVGGTEDHTPVPAAARFFSPACQCRRIELAGSDRAYRKDFIAGLGIGCRHPEQCRILRLERRDQLSELRLCERARLDRDIEVMGLAQIANSGERTDIDFVAGSTLEMCSGLRGSIPQAALDQRRFRGLNRAIALARGRTSLARC